MGVFISGLGCISPQQTINADFKTFAPISQEGDFLQCLQPESYKEFINPIISRRLSRIIKMGIASAVISQRESGVAEPGAIITGTGLGCVEDTEKFLMTMLDNNETLMNPTNFMQSTYNTISSQIAIILKCFGYNSTYVHRGFSFESALVDAMDLIRTGNVESALVGGIDEFTANHFAVTSLTGRWRKNAQHHLDLAQNPENASIPGEGSVFAMLTSDKKAHSYAELKDVKTIYKPENVAVLKDAVDALLTRHNMHVEDIDALVLGMNGNRNENPWYQSLMDVFPQSGALVFKNLCGEYYTASGFGLWLSAQIIRNNFVPEICKFKAAKAEKISNLLLYNHYAGEQHSLMLISEV